MYKLTKLSRKVRVSGGKDGSVFSRLTGYPYQLFTFMEK